VYTRFAKSSASSAVVSCCCGPTGGVVALVTLIVAARNAPQFVSQSWLTEARIYAWLYVNNWTPAYLDSPVLAQLARHGAGFLSPLLRLLRSWTTGLVLGSLSRRAIWVHARLVSVSVLLENSSRPVGGPGARCRSFR